MLRLSVHILKLTASTATIQENISLFKASIRKSVLSFPYPVPTSVRLRIFLVKIWKHTGGRCPLEVIQCEYHSVGCEIQMARKDQEKHENEKMKDHLVKTVHELTSTKATLSDTEHKLTDANNQLTIIL